MLNNRFFLGSLEVHSSEIHYFIENLTDQKYIFTQRQ